MLRTKLIGRLAEKSREPLDGADISAYSCVREVCDPQNTSMEYSSLAFLEPWEEFAPGQGAAFLSEIQVELSPGHALHGTKVTAIAHSSCADDALFRLVRRVSGFVLVAIP